MSGTARALAASQIGAQPGGHRRVRHFEYWSLAAFACLALGLRLAYANHGGLAYDEYEHMHAAYLVAHGATPFVDFFEHHTPLFYYFAASILPLRTPSFDTMIEARYLSLAAQALTIGLAVCWVRSVVGRAAALVVGILLAGNFCLFVWGTRTYLDTYAAPLLLVSAWALPVQNSRPWRSLLAGATLGLAVLVTQKAVMAAPASAAVFALRLLAERRARAARNAVLCDAAAYVTGALAALGLLPVLLGFDGVAAFVRDAVVLNLHWKARHFPWHQLAALCGSEGFIYVTAVVAVLGGLSRLVRHRHLEAADVSWLFTVSLAMGIVVIPVVWEEYFVLVLPFAVIVAGMTVLRWWRRYLALDAVVPPQRCALAWGAIAGGFLLLSTIDLIGLRFSTANPLSFAAFACVPPVWLALSVVGVLARRWRRSWEPAIWLAVLLILPMAQQADWTPRHPNDGERARVDFIMRVTAATDPVFDGRSGFGVFRPHAYRYWFLHDEMQMMLSDAEKGPDIVRALETQRVPVVIVDEFTRLLPRVVLDYIATHYVDSPFPEIKLRAATEGRGQGPKIAPVARAAQ